MTTIEGILAFLAGETQSLPANTNTEAERLLKKAAQRISAGLLPTPAAPSGDDPSADAGKVPTVQDDGTYELAAVTSSDAEPTT